MGFNMINGVFYATTYHPIQAGSIDGTDIAPHDNGVYRALLASSTGLCMLSLFLSPTFRIPCNDRKSFIDLVLSRLSQLTEICVYLICDNMANGNLDFLLKHRYVNRLSLMRTSIGINFGWKFVRR